MDTFGNNRAAILERIMRTIVSYKITDYIELINYLCVLKVELNKRKLLWHIICQ